MTNSGENNTPLPPIPVQSRSSKPQQNRHRPSAGQGRFPSNRRSGGNQGKSGPGRPHQRRNQASDQYNKYMNLAKEAAASGDDITAETYYQHADHYYRVMNPVPTA